MTKKRSLGLTLLGWFEILMGVGGLLIFLFWEIVAILYWFEQNGSNFSEVFSIVFFIFFRVGVMPILILIFGIKIIKMKCWNTKFFIYKMPFLFILYILARIAINFTIPDWKDIEFNLRYIAFCIVSYLGVVFYLTRPKIKAQFFKNIEDQSKEASTPKGAVQ